MTSPQPRRSSFGMLLKRSKSGDFGKGKKAQALKEAELERQRQAAASRVPPKLPEFSNHSEQLSKSLGPDLQSSEPAYSLSPGHHGVSRGSAEAPRSYSAANHPPVPPVPFDPYARTESMTHRGRYSYASSAISTINSPRRVRRRKDPTPFNILVIGTRGSGKTSFIEFLKTAFALPAHKRPTRKPEEDDFKVHAPASGNFVPHYLETEIDSERIGLTLWDSEGVEKNLVDLQLREMSGFLESKFEETFAEEMKVVRSPGVQDTHIHAVFFVLDPAALDRNIASARKAAGYQNGGVNGLNHRTFGGLDHDVDLQILRALSGKTTVIPVIAKADTVTTKHMNVLKKAVWDSIKKANLDPLEALGLDDEGDDLSGRIDEEDEEAIDDEPHMMPSPPTSPNSKRLSSQSIRKHKAQPETKEDDTPFLPLSIISPDLYEPGVAGRQFPWGFADPYNETHCDFQRLKEAVFSEWRAELREASREQWYEGWRTNKLNRGTGASFRAR
ncbi:Sep4b [Purpureocillium lilacinum]|uniref:Sep4b n=2 Tax=Purpureocillium lilacinum TaxID=33203 RepID=A0A179HWI9_PURLI|nr:Sep4b [Purpureocillium lilacinum]OAQ86302.1 Sep4b [Purpureocillium lilacinum]OAQ94262.1 Sep4b [Purpureocillium lilacinum]